MSTSIIITPQKSVLSIFMKSVVSRKATRRLSTCSAESDATGATALTEQSDFSEIDLTVRFAPTTDVCPSLARKDYTPQEMRACWYQGEEYRKITKECCKQIKKMQNGEVLKDKKYCSRGLESHTRLAAISKTLNRQTAINAVLDEQEDQWQMGVGLDEDIAQRYQQTTSSCQLWASTVGLRDQRVAEEYMD
jgi:hypothetical protein